MNLLKMTIRRPISTDYDCMDCIMTHRYIQCERLVDHCESLEVFKLIQISYLLFHFNHPLLYPGQSLAELLGLVV